MGIPIAEYKRRAQDKLDEVGFFLQCIQDEEGGKSLANRPRAFRFFLSAFLNAAYSVTELVEAAAMAGLKAEGLRTDRKKARFKKWEKAWPDRLSEEERLLWTQMGKNRGDEVHAQGADTTTKVKVVPLEPPRHSLHPAYYSMCCPPPVALFGDPWREEKQKIALPPWSDGWRELEEHYFTVEEKRYRAIEACEGYAALLQRYLADFQQDAKVN